MSINYINGHLRGHIFGVSFACNSDCNAQKMEGLVETRRREFIFGDYVIHIACRSTPDIESEEASGKDELLSTDEINLPIDEGQTSVDQVGWDIWESATDLLCRFLVAYPHLVRDRHVIELGAGVGVVSILAAKLEAANVVCTDYDTVALSMASLNAKLNHVSHICDFETFDWDCSTLPFSLAGDGSSTLLLGSDLMYSSACASKLRKAIIQILSQQPSALMLLSHEVRHSVTWGQDEFGERQPVVETVDSVLETFLGGCYPLIRNFSNFSDNDAKDVFEGARLHACLLPFVPMGDSAVGDEARGSREETARREMCSAAEVEEMTLQLMRAAMDKGLLVCPNDAPSSTGAPMADDTPAAAAAAPAPAAGSRTRDMEERVQVDTSRSGETLLLAFALDARRLAWLRDAVAAPAAESALRAPRPP